MFPINFIEHVSKAPGFEEKLFTEAHQAGAGLTSIRINPMKCTDVLSLDFGDNIDGRVPWCEHGAYLKHRPAFILDPLLHAGAYYVQEASSMFLAHALKQAGAEKPLLNVLDISAAPGGKSTLINAVISSSSLLVSNEVIKPRANVLTENLTKWGYPNVVVTNNDPRDFAGLPSFFDIIVADAPCSGSGMFRKDPASANEWSIANVGHCAARQQRIIADMLPCLKENGYLIYSTCSYSIEENEAVVDHCMEEYGMATVKIPVDESWNILESTSGKGGYGYRFYPGKVKGEGFFLAILKKEKEDRARYRASSPAKLQEAGKAETEAARKTIIEGDAYYNFKHNEAVRCLPAVSVAAFNEIMANLYVKKAGTELGSMKGREWIPCLLYTSPSPRD